jgi:3-hydroxybutyryl-CoA dehydrogenase
MMNKISIVGAGIMGSGIAQISAQAGYEVVITDVDQEHLDRGIAQIANTLDRGVQRGFLEESAREKALGLIQTTLDLEEIAQAPFIIETIWEEESAKVELLGKLDKLSAPDTILASNTSSIPITNLAVSAQQPGRIVGMHFFNPPYAMNLVEVIRGYHTTDEAVAKVVEVSETLGKRPVVIQDSPGFVVNRLVAPFLNEAAMILQEGVATKEDIDECVRLGLNHPMGPFQLMDLIGLDITFHEISSIFERTGDSKYRPSTLLRKMVTAGQLGRKTGSGWYTY